MSVWKGSTNLQIQPGYPRIREDREGSRIVWLYHGPYQLCKAAKPSYGATVQGYPDIKVQVVEVRSLRGGAGELYFEAYPPPPDDGTSPPSSGAAGSEPMYELHWMTREIPVVLAPELSGLGEEEARDVEVKFRLSNGSVPVQYDVLIDAWTNLQKRYYDLLSSGKESVPFNFPTVIKRTFYRTRPEAASGGFLDTPPTTFGLTAFEWLKSGERILGGSRSWEKVEEWEGIHPKEKPLLQQS